MIFGVGWDYSFSVLYHTVNCFKREEKIIVSTSIKAISASRTSKHPPPFTSFHSLLVSVLMNPIDSSFLVVNIFDLNSRNKYPPSSFNAFHLTNYFVPPRLDTTQLEILKENT